ncbi:ROK family transcriptional regulator [Micromonospora sp. NPDC050686]|uniref:ROK family transcriptional regulator n=1 Tax=Micromonospora sp. NPDC050686 TaxID=3154631 RepID=UPI0033D2CB29
MSTGNFDAGGGGARTARWRTAVDVVRHLRHHPRPTRADLARDLALTSGSATEITGRLRRAKLLSEEPAPVAGRGRPTTLLRPHPEGPLTLAVEIRHEESRCAVATVDGRLHDVRTLRHDDGGPEQVRAGLAAAVRELRRRHRARLRVVSLAVAATVRDGRVVQSAALGWGPVDLAPLTAGTHLPLLVGNDATLAGVAEARTGATAGARTALHLLVDVGVGGGLVVDGRPVVGATGAGGEVGHLPLGDPGRHCPCGATGCWDLEVDGRAIARHLGDAPPTDARDYAHRMLARAASGDTGAALAVRRVVAALGRGTAGLVNAHDPDAVSLGGLAGPLRAAAPDDFQAAYAGGLMAFHRDRPPPVLDAAHGDLGALRGAAEVGLDRMTTGAALAEWHGVATGDPAQSTWDRN